MPFDTALSGIRAASSHLSVTGNNIANASTVGFKNSRAEFGDVYATSVLGAGGNSIGSGIRLQDVAQQFTQGNVSFTENELDLAINGNGFFVVQQGGEQFYTRAGTFGMDRDGYITNNLGARLQGFPADSTGRISGLQADVRIQTSNLAPRPTTGVESMLNLNSAEEVLQSDGTQFQTDGNAIGVAQVGLEQSTTTSLSSSTLNLPLPFDFSSDTMTFDVEMSAGTGNNGTVSVRLNTNNGVPANIQTFNDLRTLAGAINAQIFSPIAPQTPIDVVASAVDLGGGNFELQFNSIQDGESSQIRVQNGSPNITALGLPAGPNTAVSDPGIARVSNNYPRQSIDIVNPQGNTVSYTSEVGASAARVASEMNALAGVSATAQTQMRFVAGNYNNSEGNLQVTLNGVSVQGTTLERLGERINFMSASTLPGVRAELDPATGDLVVTSSVGDDLKVGISSSNDGDSVEILGNPNAPTQILEVDLNGNLNLTNATAADGNSIVVGGTIDIVLSEGYRAANANPPSIGLFGPLTSAAFQPVTINAFDPDRQSTYNSATSMTIYDSLGNPHVLSQYFVKQDYDPADPTTSPNHWRMYVQVDGQNVGDPDTTLPPPDNTRPTMASFNVHFNADGSLNTTRTDDMLISNWVPRDKRGEPTGALGPQNVLAGGNVNIPDPPTSSNFVIDMNGTTQFGSAFSVNDVDQNGYTTGRLSGLNIAEDGVIFARFTNGESQVLGQVVLADFANVQGLQPVGGTMWAENFASGQPNIGAPGSAALGVIQAGALEESNVDLSEELVSLIVAQRNFQASAKTIETADQVTQTIINLR